MSAPRYIDLGPLGQLRPAGAVATRAGTCEVHGCRLPVAWLWCRKGKATVGYCRQHAEATFPEIGPEAAR